MAQKITYTFEDEMVNQSTDFIRKYSIKDKTDYTEITDITEYDAPSVGKTNTLNAEIMNDIVDAINELINKTNSWTDFSIGEVAIGTWIDGKTLYRKAVDFGALPNNTTKYVAHGISNLNEFVSVDAYVSWPSNETVLLGYYYGNNTSAQMQARADATNVSISTSTDRSSLTGKFILTYTKQ